MFMPFDFLHGVANAAGDLAHAAADVVDEMAREAARLPDATDALGCRPVGYESSDRPQRAGGQGAAPGLGGCAEPLAPLSSPYPSGRSAPSVGICHRPSATCSLAVAGLLPKVASHQPHQ
jgi:hypothetical protein